MTLTLHWWMLPVALFLLPFIWEAIRRDEGGYFDMHLDTLTLLFVGWAAAVGIIIGHFVH